MEIGKRLINFSPIEIAPLDGFLPGIESNLEGLVRVGFLHIQRIDTK